MNKHVAVFGGLRQLHQKLRERGARLTLFVEADKLAYWDLRAEDRELYDRIIALPLPAMPDEWVDLAAAVHRHDPFTAIGAYHEMNADMAANVALHLKLPFHAPETIESIRNKHLMRRKLREAAVDPTQSARVKAAADVAAFAEAHGYPLILKPIDGWASIGVSRIMGPGEIPNALIWFQQWTPDSEMCVEPYLCGPEYSVEAFSEHGEHRIVCITEKFKENEHFVEVGHCVPAKFDPALEVAIHRVVRQSLTVLGVQSGGSHTEIILTTDGPRIVETHSRLGGDSIPDLVSLAFGIDLMDLWARQTLGEQSLSELPAVPILQQYAAIWYTSLNAVGTVEKVDGLADAQSSPGVARVEVLQGPGSRVERIHSSFSRAAYAIAIGNSPEEAVQRAQEAVGKLRFMVVCQGARQEEVLPT